MSIKEQKGVLTYIDQDGVKTQLYPTTKKELVEGLSDATSGISGLMSAADKAKFDTIAGCFPNDKELIIGNKLRLYTNTAEGGNIRIVSPDTIEGVPSWEMDSYDGNFRIVGFNGPSAKVCLTLHQTGDISDGRGNTLSNKENKLTSDRGSITAANSSYLRVHRASLLKYGGICTATCSFEIIAPQGAENIPLVNFSIPTKHEMFVPLMSRHPSSDASMGIYEAQIGANTQQLFSLSDLPRGRYAFSFSYPIV